MTREKTLLLQNGRSVKVITRDLHAVNPTKIEIEVLIKDPKELEYHPPIGITHPKYWKLKTMDPQKSRLLQLEYSGLSDKEIRKAIRELKNGTW